MGGQTLGHITNLAASVPLKYRRWGIPASRSVASLTFVTTSDVSIAKSVLVTAAIHNIVVMQYKAEFRRTLAGLEVRFVLSARNGLTFSNGLRTSSVIMR